MGLYMSIAHRWATVLFSVTLYFCAHPAAVGQEVEATQENVLDLESLNRVVREQQSTIESQQARIDALSRNSARDAAPRVFWEGYGVVNYTEYDFFRNAQDDSPDRRKKFDIERFVLELEHYFSDRVSLEAEIEFEHGGTGATLEYEPEEFGEYELEVEKGGEVKLEELQLVIDHSSILRFRVGHIIVPFGMVNTHHHPTDYFTTERSLAEVNVIPTVWDENGVELFGFYGDLDYSFLIVNSLDSSGFSGYNWIATGHQGGLEHTNADNLAFVTRLDYRLARGVLLGGAFYSGDSADNRPKQNLDVSARVSLVEVHGRYERNRWKVRGQWLQGSVENSDAVSQANLQTSNAALLGISRTSVGHKAESFFIEAGYDISRWVALSAPLDVFARYDHYDTMAEVEGNVADLARYDRQAVTVGVNYSALPGIVVKAEFSSREHEGTIGNESDLFALGIGFEF